MSRASEAPTLAEVPCAIPEYCSEVIKQHGERMARIEAAYADVLKELASMRAAFAETRQAVAEQEAACEFFRRPEFPPPPPVPTFGDDVMTDLPARPRCEIVVDYEDPRPPSIFERLFAWVRS
jgi:hypothetical protein